MFKSSIFECLLVEHKIINLGLHLEKHYSQKFLIYILIMNF